MRIFDLAESITKDTKELNEKSPQYNIKLKDIFNNYQLDKITLVQAKTQIAHRINKFVNNSKLDKDVKRELFDLKNKIKSEKDDVAIDELINLLYDIADANDILVK